MVVGDQRQALAALPAGKRPSTGGPVGPETVWTGTEFSVPPEFEPRTVQPDRVAVTTTLTVWPFLQWHRAEGMRVDTSLSLGLYTSLKLFNVF